MVSKHKAFGIVQISVIIMIISVLATSVLLTSGVIIENQRTTLTLRKIDNIYKAIGVFVLANKRLPCPASLKTVKSVDPVNYGLSVGTAGNCVATGVYQNAGGATPNVIYGMIPVATLGLSNDAGEDGFGSRIVYMVDQRFTKDDSVSAGFGLTAVSNNIIIKRNIAGVYSVDTVNPSGAIFVIISPGSNKYGSFNANSNAQTAISSDADEKNNLNDNTNIFDVAVNFDNIVIASSNTGGVFDDIVFYKDRNQLIADFDGYNLIPCAAVSNYITVNGTGMSWPQSSYNQIVISSTSCPTCWTGGVLKPTLQCNEYGVWSAAVTDACIQIHGGPCP
jgi:hypothetical protein